MRVTFVGLGWEQLGISLLSAIARREGHEVQLAFSAALFNDRYNLSIPSLAPYFDDRREVIAAIRRQRPDVLACSPLTGTYQWMLGVAAEAKVLNPRLKVVFGGVHASAVPERVLARGEVDYVCVGEGDVAFPSILRAIADGRAAAPIVNTRFKLPDGKIVTGLQDGFIQDLDALPVFDKTLWEEHMRVGDIYFTMASRGCPYRCTFCFNSYFAKLPQGPSGKYVRQRGVEHMMSELRFAKRRYKLRIVEFEDDVFTVNKKWLKEFLRAYKKEIAVPFQCLTHPRYMDEDVAGWLREAGCVYVQMGIQTMDDDFKRSTINRMENAREVEQALEVMRRHRISSKVDHMFGLPGEPLAAQETARQLYVRHPPYRIQTFWTNYFPGTELTQRAVLDGTITASEAEKLYDGVGFDFFRQSSRGIELEKLKVYRAYEVMFKLIPVLPPFLRRRLSLPALSRLPSMLSRLISFMTDALAGLFLRNPDHWGYARHYGYHMFRSVARKLGLRVPPATRPLPASGHTGKPIFYRRRAGRGQKVRLKRGNSMKRILGGMALVIVLLGSGMVSVGQAEVYPKNGELREFYDDGSLKFFRKYKHGLLVIQRAYYRDGQLSLERRYKNGQLIRQRKFYENGQLESDLDNRKGVIKVYGKDGHLEHTINSNHQDVGAYRSSYISGY